MSKIIRIGTRDSELALWQAKTVQKQLEFLGHKTQLVPVKSTGDLVLNKPLYELGITGIFTRTLDIAMLNNEIDIAVHSLKDVPTILPKGIVQAAVLKRGKFSDLLVFKNNEEFLAQKNGIIATGSLRRKAQWLNRYPTHTVVDLRGNVNTRLQKLNDNDWNGAIFATAGVERIGLKPEDAIILNWMVPAPGQGAVMITALEENTELREVLKELNHEETEMCVATERKFLNLLEGGCTAPIGALAYIKKEEIHFKGVLLSKDGTKKIEVSGSKKPEHYLTLAEECAEKVLKKGGNRLMDDLKLERQETNIYSTKTLTETQKHLFQNGIVSDSSDFIKIKLNRIPKNRIKQEIENVIITSKNAVEALLASFSPDELQFKNIYCVGRRTKRLIEERIGPVKHTARNAKKLAEYLVEYIEGTEATFFCSDIRLDDLPTLLSENKINLTEIVAYETELSSTKINENIEGVMFFSPSTVQSFLLKNKADKIAFCIGETTATEAKQNFKDVRVAKLPTVESVIELVNEHYT
ncbi:hydroxymethylbilane synthase [Saonia flava]|uniref:Hydroxymethylbilane synthase n=1 Tax=Saonia flava TaxID=523696 RepID=A0A846QTU1_9FLAO|nr:hydroxymethylbilane synthase [Saonia flava]NJB71621.1 hydroxymethylbilane synthase [Saonia flava]